MMNIIEHVDALEEAKKNLEVFEKKYGITSECFSNAQYEPGAISAKDAHIWKFYLRNFIRCGGQLETTCKENDFKHEELLLENKNEPIYTTDKNNLIINSNIKKRGDEFSSLFYYNTYIGMHKIL